jgi:hypothetical protein
MKIQTREKEPTSRGTTARSKSRRVYSSRERKMDGNVAMLKERRPRENAEDGRERPAKAKEIKRIGNLTRILVRT